MGSKTGSQGGVQPGADKEDKNQSRRSMRRRKRRGPNGGDGGSSDDLDSDYLSGEEDEDSDDFYDDDADGDSDSDFESGKLRRDRKSRRRGQEADGSDAGDFLGSSGEPADPKDPHRELRFAAGQAVLGSGDAPLVLAPGDTYPRMVVEVVDSQGRVDRRVKKGALTVSTSDGSPLGQTQAKFKKGRAVLDLGVLEPTTAAERRLTLSTDVLGGLRLQSQPISAPSPLHGLRFKEPPADVPWVLESGVPWAEQEGPFRSLALEVVDSEGKVDRSADGLLLSVACTDPAVQVLPGAVPFRGGVADCGGLAVAGGSRDCALRFAVEKEGAHLAGLTTAAGRVYAPLHEIQFTPGSLFGEAAAAALDASTLTSLDQSLGHSRMSPVATAAAGVACVPLGTICLQVVDSEGAPARLEEGWRMVATTPAEVPLSLASAADGPDLQSDTDTVALEVPVGAASQAVFPHFTLMEPCEEVSVLFQLQDAAGASVVALHSPPVTVVADAEVVAAREQTAGTRKATKAAKELAKRVQEGHATEEEVQQYTVSVAAAAALLAAVMETLEWGLAKDVSRREWGDSWASEENAIDDVLARLVREAKKKIEAQDGNDATQSKTLGPNANGGRGDADAGAGAGAGGAGTDAAAAGAGGAGADTGLGGASPDGATAGVDGAHPSLSNGEKIRKQRVNKLAKRMAKELKPDLFRLKDKIRLLQAKVRIEAHKERQRELGIDEKDWGPGGIQNWDGALPNLSHILGRSGEATAQMLMEVSARFAQLAELARLGKKDFQIVAAYRIIADDDDDDSYGLNTPGGSPPGSASRKSPTRPKSSVTRVATSTSDSGVFKEFASDFESLASNVQGHGKGAGIWNIRSNYAAAGAGEPEKTDSPRTLVSRDISHAEPGDSSVAEELEEARRGSRSRWPSTAGTPKTAGTPQKRATVQGPDVAPDAEPAHPPASPPASAGSKPASASVRSPEA